MEVNPQNVKQADLAIGIPSYNESDTIADVVRQMDRGLEKYFSSFKKVIINVDNDSPDQTRDIFLNTFSSVPKIYISTAPSLRGKGYNLFNFFKKIDSLGVKAAMVVDADLKSSTYGWVYCLLSPILEGYDFILPFYKRHEYDGSITNNICYPLLYGLLGWNIRQPIGGEMAFSGRLSRYWINQIWDENIFHYGIDIFMTLNAIKGGFNIAQVDLGVKVHKPSGPKLDEMFFQVVSTLFNFLIANKNFWLKDVSLSNIPIVCRFNKNGPLRELIVDAKFLEKNAVFGFRSFQSVLKRIFSSGLYDEIKKSFENKKGLTAELWVRIVYDSLYAYDKTQEKKEIIEVLKSLYFARMIGFIRETFQKDHFQSEEMICNQARLFYKKRNYLISKF